MKKFVALGILVLLSVYYLIFIREESYLRTADAAQVSAPVERDSLSLVINSNYLQVRHIFEKSCFDCHSKLTNYPWYYQVPLVKELIDQDIQLARGDLDFSNDYPFGGSDDLAHLLEEIKEEIEEDKMPLQSYRLTHWGRLIEGARRDSVFTWIDESLALLKSKK